MSDDYNDVFDEIRKFFKFNSNLFDADFFIFPESDKDLDFNKKNTSGFKISYHFESGMDEPEIKIEGDIDEKKLLEYLKKHNIESDSRFKKLFDLKSKGVIDAKELSLEPNKNKEKTHVIEPHTEINSFHDFTEIILEVPGIQMDDVILSINNDERKVTFSARNKFRNYLKHIYLPLNTPMEDYSLDVNNGIATLKFRRQ